MDFDVAWYSIDWDYKLSIYYSICHFNHLCVARYLDWGNWKMNDDTEFEICYAILAEINQIMLEYHKELPTEGQKILEEMADRISNHFYGDVE